MLEELQIEEQIPEEGQEGDNPPKKKRVPTPDEVLGTSKRRVPTPDEILKKKEDGVSPTSLNGNGLQYAVRPKGAQPLQSNLKETRYGNLDDEEKRKIGNVVSNEEAVQQIKDYQDNAGQQKEFVSNVKNEGLQTITQHADSDEIKKTVRNELENKKYSEIIKPNSLITGDIGGNIAQKYQSVKERESRKTAAVNVSDEDVNKAVEEAKKDPNRLIQLADKSLKKMKDSEAKKKLMGALKSVKDANKFELAELSLQQPEQGVNLGSLVELNKIANQIGENKRQIESGELGYNPRTGDAVHTMSTPEAIFKGLSSVHNEAVKYEDFKKLSPEQKIKELEANKYSVTPKEEGGAVYELASFVPVIIKQAAVTAATGGGGSLVAKVIGALSTTPDFYKMRHTDIVQSAYPQLKQSLKEKYVVEGMDEKEADKKASTEALNNAEDIADARGKIAGVEGGALSFLGGKAGKYSPIRFSEGTLTGLKDIFKSYGEKLSATATEAAQFAGLSGFDTYVGNLYAASKGQKIDPEEGVTQHMMQMAKLPLLMGLVGRTAKIGGAAFRASFINDMTRVEPAVVDNALQESVNKGIIDPENATEIKGDIEALKEVKKKIPNADRESIHAIVPDIVEKLNEVDELKQKVDDAHDAFKPALKEKLKEKQEEVNQMVEHPIAYANEKAKKEVEQVKDEEGYSEKFLKPEVKYRGQHQIAKPLFTADKITEAGGHEDFFENPNTNYDLSEPSYKESYRALKQIKDNPDEEVTVYRAVPEGVDKINEGDWISLSKTYAKEHGMHESDPSKDMPVISMKVKAKDIGWDGNDINEFSYNPKATDGESNNRESSNQPTEEIKPETPPLKEDLGGKPIRDVVGKSDADIENRMSELERKISETKDFDEAQKHQSEFNSLEKEMEKRERDSVFSVPLDKVGESIDALMKKEKEMPNGFGSFIEKRDAKETKEVADKYLNSKDIPDEEIKTDFKNALMGNPDTWYADGLKLRESMKEATSRGIDIETLLGEAEKEFTKDGYDSQTAKEVIAGRLQKVFKDSTKEQPKETNLIEGLTPEPVSLSEETPPPEPPIEEQPALNIEDEGKRTGIKNTVSQDTRAIRELPAVEIPKLGKDAHILIEGKDLVDNGKIKPEEVITRINSKDGEGMTTDEAKAMQYYMHQLGTAEDVVRKQLSQDLEPQEKLRLVGQLGQLNDMQDAATEANIKAGRTWSDVGNIRQILIDQSFNPSREKAAIKDAYGGEIPKEVQEKINGLTKERDEALLQRDKLEEQLRQKEAGVKVEEMKKSRTKKQSGDFKADRKGYIDELKKVKEAHEKWLKDKGIQKQGVSGFTLTPEMLKIVGKIAKSYVEEGLQKLEEVVNKVYEDIKEIFGEDVDKKVVRDAIAMFEAEKLNKTAENKESKIESGDIFPKSKLKTKFEQNNDWVKANQRVINAEYKMRKLKNEAFNSQKNMYQKALMWMSRLVRASVLSGTNVLYKLAAAATIGGAGKRIPEQMIGGIYSQVFKGIAKKAPIEGFYNAKAEAKFYKEFFNPKKFIKNSWEILKSGSSDLTKKMDGRMNDDLAEITMPGKQKTITGKIAKGTLKGLDKITTFPTDLHMVIKDPVKRATFEASMENGLVNAEKSGLDINDPLVINAIENAAYKRANYEIFQEQNWLSKKFNAWKDKMDKSGNAGATGKFVADFMIPVSTVPTNIVRRLVSTSPAGLIRGAAKVTEAYRKGIENLSNEEADAVMRQLKQGTLGTALWLIGWMGAKHFGGLYSKYDPNKKRKEGELTSDEMEVNGKMIPKPVQHALPLEIIQTAATARHIYDNYRDNKDASQFESLLNAGLGSAGALAEQIPIVATAGLAVEGLNDPYKGNKFKEDIKRRFEPQILRETGVIGDKKDPLKKLQHKYADSENIFRNDLKVRDKQGNLKEVSKEDFHTYKSQRDEKINADIEKLYNHGIGGKKFDELTEQEVRDEITYIKNNATKETKEKLFGKQKESSEDKKEQSTLSKQRKQLYQK